MLSKNPCLSCGACCAHFRVSFYWGEADPEQEGSVPIEWIEDLPPYHACMKGTNQKHPRCAALEGVVGEGVRCAIYDLRPSPCKEFGVHFAHNALWFDPGELERCNRARMDYGFAPIAAPDSEPALGKHVYRTPDYHFWPVLPLHKIQHHPVHRNPQRKPRRRRPGGGGGNNFPASASPGMGV